MTTVNHNMTSQRSRSQLVVLLHFGDGGTRSCHPYPADLRHRSSHHTHVPTNCGTRAEPGLAKSSITNGLVVSVTLGAEVGSAGAVLDTRWTAEGTGALAARNLTGSLR